MVLPRGAALRRVGFGQAQAAAAEDRDATARRNLGSGQDDRCAGEGAATKQAAVMDAPTATVEAPRKCLRFSFFPLIISPVGSSESCFHWIGTDDDHAGVRGFRILCLAFMRAREGCGRILYTAERL
ncbi:MAG: hypothetical protein OXC13_18535 [Caldilineaceae bacterium]|nr:hypothetical protein [Caldilineaceae bacterium]